MKKIIYQICQHYLLILLLIIAIITHINWFKPSTTLSSGDWLFFSDEVVKQLWRSWATWITFGHFGFSNPQISFYFFKSIWSVISHLGFSFNVATIITFFIPIAILGFVSPYILFKNLFQDNFIAFIASLFYGTTTPFLVRQTAHLPIAFVYALTPLVLNFFILSINQNRFSYWLIFVSLFSISFFYEPRITLIVLLILIIYFFIDPGKIKKYLKNAIVSSVILIGFNSFWLLPTFLTSIFDNISILKNRGLFGDWLFDLPHSIALYESSWTGKYPNMQFVKQPILWYFWIVPIFITISLFIKNKHAKEKLLFFWVISLIGILLTKQTSAPFTNLYGWLYDNFSAFGLYREASKFFLLTALGYSGLLGYSLLFTRDFFYKINMKGLFSVISLIIISLSLWNTKPLLTKEFRTLFISKNIPNDYFIVKQFILNQPDYFRTLWVPTNSRWSFFIDNHPVAGVVTIADYWNKIINPGFLESLPLFKYSFSNQLLDLVSAKYIFIPLQDKLNDDDFFSIYGKRQPLIDYLDKLTYLKKINIGTKEIVAYENKNYRPHIYQTFENETIYKNIPYQKISFSYVNPTEYKIYLKDLKKPVYLNFSESYHPDWKLRVGGFNWFNALINKKYFLTDKNHFQNDAQLNSFYLDPKDLCNKKTCSNINLTLYFKPQSYFYIGLIISIIVFTFTIIFFIITILKNKSIHSNTKL